MKEKIKRISERIVASGVDLRVVNEAVVRAAMFALLRGRTHQYKLEVRTTSEGLKYSYDVSTMGTTVDCDRLRTWCARDVVSENVRTSKGFESLCRYVFSIIAFMPTYAEDLLASMSARSGNSSPITQTIVELHSALQGQKKKYNNQNWDRAYKVFRSAFLKAADASSDAALDDCAHKVFSSKACNEISEQLKILLYILQEESVIDNPAKVVELLSFLSNFDPEIGKYHKLHKRSSSHFSDDKFSLEVDIEGVRQAAPRWIPWHQRMDLAVDRRMNQCAVVGIGALVAFSMLFDMHVEIKPGNVEAVLLDDKRVAYSFTRDFSFPLLKQARFGNISNGILESAAGRELVDLMIQNHHARDCQRFKVCYGDVASAIKNFHKFMQNDKMRESIASSIIKTLDPDKNPNVRKSTEIYNSVMEVVSHIDARVRFLKDFVDSPEYGYLEDFLFQSKCSDNHEHFRSFLNKRKMAIGRRPATASSTAASDRLAPPQKPHSRLLISGVVLTLISLLSFAVGIWAICHYALFAPSSIGFLVGGCIAVVFGMGMAKAAIVSLQKQYNLPSVGEQAEMHDPCDDERALEEDKRHKSERGPKKQQCGGHLIPITVEHGTRTNSINAAS
ncbi:MAG: hypothetical protein ACTJLL_00575 [Anaplasma sp.]